MNGKPLALTDSDFDVTDPADFDPASPIPSVSVVRWTRQVEQVGPRWIEVTVWGKS